MTGDDIARMLGIPPDAPDVHHHTIDTLTAEGREEHAEELDALSRMRVKVHAVAGEPVTMTVTLNAENVHQ